MWNTVEEKEYCRREGILFKRMNTVEDKEYCKIDGMLYTLYFIK